MTQESPRGERSAARILIVVSDPLLRLNLSSRLRLLGCEVEVTENGGIARKKLHSFGPQAVVLDLTVDDDAGDKIIQDFRKDPAGGKVTIVAFASSPSARVSRRAAKAGASKVFTENPIPFDGIINELSAHFPTQESDTAALRRVGGPGANGSSPVANEADLKEALTRLCNHVVLLAPCKDYQARAAVCGELRAKLQPVLSLVRFSQRPGAHRLCASLHSLLKVLHEMPECATLSTQRTVIGAVEVLVDLCTAPEAPEPLELTAVIADNDPFSRSIVCSSLRSVGFKFECFAHPSVVLKYLDNAATDLVIAHLGLESAGDPAVADHLRARARSAGIPVIFVSGVSDFEKRSELAAQDEDEVITKPFIFMELSVKSLALALKKKFPKPASRLAPDEGIAALAAGTPATRASEAHAREMAHFEATTVRELMATLAPPTVPPADGISDSHSELTVETRAGTSGTVTQFTTLREELEKKRQEREKLVAKIFNSELELEQIRVTLNEEREQRRQLELMVQDLMVGQASAPAQPVVTPEGETTKFERGPATDAQATDLKRRLDALAAEAESLRESLAAKQKEREQLATRIFNDERELDAYREALETERAQREALETRLNATGGTPHANPAAVPPDSQGLQQEVAKLRSSQEELVLRLSQAEAENAADFKRQAELDVSLRELTAELEQARNARQAGEEERQRLEAELNQKRAEDAVALELGQSAVSQQTENAARLHHELEALRQQNAQLETAQSAKVDLEHQLAEANAQLAAGRAAQAELADARQRLEADLSRKLADVHGQVASAETARDEAAARGRQLQSELDQLWKAQEELDARLATEKQTAAGALAQKTDLDARVRSIAEELEQSRVALANAQSAAQREAGARQELEAQAARLRTELDQKASSQVQLNTEVGEQKSALEKKRKKLEAELAAAQQRADELSKDRDRVQRELSSQLVAAQNATAVVDQNLRDAVSRGDRMAGEVASLREARTQGEARIAEAQAVCEELSKQFESAKASVSRLAEEKLMAESRLKAGVEAVAAEQRRNAEMLARLSVAETMAAEAVAARNQESARAGEFEAEVTQLWKVRDSLKAVVEADQRTIEEFTAKQGAIETQLAETSRKFAASCGDLEQARANVAKKDELNQRLTERNAALQTETSGLAERQVAHEQELSAMERRVRDSLSAIARSTAELETERGDRRRVEQRAAGQAAQLQELHRELNSHLEIEKENQTRLAELEQEVAARTGELDAERRALETERGDRRQLEQRAESLGARVESLRGELSERQRLDQELQLRIGNLEQQLRVREESLVRVTQHLETERGERRRVEQRADGLTAQTQTLQGQLDVTGQQDREKQHRIAQLEEQAGTRAKELEALQSGISSERAERRKFEERAQSLSAQLRDLHGELNRHLQLEKESQTHVAELEQQLAERNESIAQTLANLEKETADRKLAEEQVRAAGDIAAKLQQQRANFEEARSSFARTQAELESRLQATAAALAEREASLEREAAEKASAHKELELSRRELQMQSQQSALEISKLQSALQVASMERQQLEGDALHTRYASLQSSRSGRSLVNNLRRQLEKPVDQLMRHACKLLAFEMSAELKQTAEALLETAVTLQSSVRESDVVDLAAGEKQADRTADEGSTQ